MRYAVPIGLPSEWTLVTLTAAAIAVGALIYVVLWRVRFGRGEASLDASLCRIRGRIEGQDLARRPALMMERSGVLWKLPRVEVRDRSGRRWRVNIGAATALRWPRRARYQRRLLRWLAVGDPVTLEGHEVLSAIGESTYRTPASEPRIEATCIIRGAWPPVRGLRLAMLLCAVLAAGGGLLHVYGERYLPFEVVLDRDRPFEVDVESLRVLRPGMLVPTCNCVMIAGMLPEDVPACCGRHRAPRRQPSASSSGGVGGRPPR